MTPTTRIARRLVTLFAAVLLAAGAIGCSEDVEPGENDPENQYEDDVVDDTDPDTDPDADDPDADDPDADDPDADDPDADDPDADDPDADNGEEPLPDMAVDDIRPDRGPLDGGTPFVVEGEGFTDDTTVMFGTAEVETDLMDGDDDDAAELTGITPSANAPGPVTVRVMDDESGEETIPEGFTYVDPLEIDDIFPPMIDADGGVEITIDGNGFSEDTTVSVDDRAASGVDYVNSSRIRFIAPPRSPGSYDVRVTNEDESVVADDALTYLAPAQIDDVDPPYGSTDGGDTVTVTGQGFNSSIDVLIDEVSAPVQQVNDEGTEVVVTTPPGDAGVVDVRIETDGDGDTLEDGFAYFDEDADEVALDGVVPSEGTTDGGQRVYLTGYFAPLSSPDVEFGDDDASVEDVDDHVIEVDTPSASAGVVDVTVDDGSETLVADDAFRFYDELQVNSVTPDEGDADGGDEVTVDGSGFDAVDDLRLAGLTVDFEVIDDSTIEFDTPAASPGLADLQLFTDDDRELLVDDAFHYLGDLELYNFEPTQGSIAGNTYVEVRGSGFTDDTQVFFGDEEAQKTEMLNPTTLAVRTPPGSTGAVDVTAEDGSDDDVADQQYTYFNPGAQTGGAWGNPIDGAVNVTVYAMGGGPIENAFVMLSTDADTEYTGATDANGLVTLSGPDVFGDQTITATAAEHSSATVQYVDAENITIFLYPPGDGDPPMPPPPPTATFTGELTGLDKLVPDPDPNEMLMAIVETTRADIDDELPDPGGDNIVFEDGEYTIQTRVGEMALVALGGLYNSSTEEFEPLWMGTERYLTAAEGGEYEVDIDLDIPLDQSINLKFEDAPLGTSGGPDTNRAVSFMNMGVDGIFGPMFEQTSTSETMSVDNLAALDDELDDVTYSFIAITDTDGDAPLVQAFVSGIDDTDASYSTPPMVSTVDVITPDEGEVANNGLVQWDLDGPVQPDLYYIYLQTFMGEIVWDIFVSGSSNSFIFPDFPDLSDYSTEDEDGNEILPMPYPGGTYTMVVMGLKGDGLSVDNYAYDQLDLDAADSISISPMMIALPDESQ